MHDVALLVTCEHAVNTVPERWQNLFRRDPGVLESHQGWDPGAFDLAQYLAKKLAAPCFAAKVSRLLVDHNRSPVHRGLWSAFSEELSEQEKTLLLNEYYLPFREQVSRWIADRLADGTRVVHLSVHTFTAVFDGKVRDVDIGILYDTDRSDESFFANIWKRQLTAACPEVNTRLNSPYLGRSDCHQNTYRRSHRSADYIGIELEVNQALEIAGAGGKVLRNLLAVTLNESIEGIMRDE